MRSARRAVPALSGAGGSGEDLTAYLSVQPGEHLYAEVGQEGTVGGGATSLGAGARRERRPTGFPRGAPVGEPTDLRLCSASDASCPGRRHLAPVEGDRRRRRGWRRGHERLLRGRVRTALVRGQLERRADPAVQSWLLHPWRGQLGQRALDEGDGAAPDGAGTAASTRTAPSRRSPSLEQSPDARFGRRRRDRRERHGERRSGGGGGGGYFGGGAGSLRADLRQRPRLVHLRPQRGRRWWRVEARRLPRRGSARTSSSAARTQRLGDVHADHLGDRAFGGATFVLGQVVHASYLCDPLVLGTCNGTVASGSPISTSSLGTHRFDVQGETAGKTLTAAVTYVVERASRTTVTCTPATVKDKHATACKATVSDTSTTGKASVPTGKVSFALRRRLLHAGFVHPQEGRGDARYGRLLGEVHPDQERHPTRHGRLSRRLGARREQGGTPT